MSIQPNNLPQRFFLLIFLVLSGCTSLGKGVAEAFFEKQESIDKRVCEIWGEAFEGIKPNLYSKTGKTKILMIHGVGDHLPGYATEFSEKLAKELDLSVTSKQHKNISLTAPSDLTKKLGNLRIQRFLNKAKTKELLFYELTWSEITAHYKKILAYDNSGEYSFRRTKLNGVMKKFSNDTGPDPIIYLGEKSRKEILTSFIQSFCWMASGRWDALPSKKDAKPLKACSIEDLSSIDSILNDHYAFVSHSLGSRIVIDGLQKIAKILGNKDEKKLISQKQQILTFAMQHKVLPLYMMSNQLPMLQLGRERPEVNNKKKAYCEPQGKLYSKRILSKTPIIAFSDPNDLLSYAIPQQFADQYLDSRLCFEVTNININVATVYDIFNLGKVANPLEAHIGYDTDDRVIGLIAKGIGHNETAKIVKERCRWIETID
ncbi:MAG: hypothetical protein KAH08_06660 [Methylococcales bacterium]|nr:hypothetical protein [Methylococcales bacterium]